MYDVKWDVLSVVVRVVMKVVVLVIVDVTRLVGEQVPSVGGGIRE